MADSGDIAVVSADVIDLNKKEQMLASHLANKSCLVIFDME